MSELGNWCLIESDPGLFTELIQKFGVSGVQVEELWGLDEELFSKLKPIHGLIFLFKWQANEEITGTVVTDERLDKIFFAKQLISNACATQAILSILMNTKSPDVKLGQILTEFKEFTQSFDPNMKGLTLSNSDTIRNVHNSFARQTLFELDDSKASKSDDVFHFVGYMPINDRIYELDGLKEGPVDLGPVPPGTDWLHKARPIIQQRINKYSSGEIHFNLMAVVSDRKQKLQSRIQEIQDQIEDNGMSSTENNAELMELQTMLAEELSKREQWAIENIRRKHNYLPLIVNMLKILAEEDYLLPMYKKALEKVQEKKNQK